MPRIYFDHNATTPPHETVITAIADAARRYFGNPSSLHEEGRAARQAVERARSEVAKLLGAAPAEIVFTSGGTESNNTAILSAAKAVTKVRGRRGQIISSPLEHPSVGSTLELLRSDGFKITALPVDSKGRIDPADLRAALSREETALVTLAYCNHELGNLYPIAEFAALAHTYGALFHCDAVQAVGRVPVDVAALGIDLLSVSAHKLYGPKGIGALFVHAKNATRDRSFVEIFAEIARQPLVRGGAQEKGRRAGTENLPGIVGFGVAAELSRSDFLPRAPQVSALRDELEAGLLSLRGARRHGDDRGRGPGTANLAFDGVEGELLFMNLDLRGIAVSTGAACSSGSPEPSAVLLALGLSRKQALEAVRFSVGPKNTSAEVKTVVAAVTESLSTIRSAQAS